MSVLGSLPRSTQGLANRRGTHRRPSVAPVPWVGTQNLSGPEPLAHLQGTGPLLSLEAPVSFHTLLRGLCPDAQLGQEDSVPETFVHLCTSLQSCLSH